MLLFLGTYACPFTRQPKVFAPVCVAGGKSDNWSAGFTICFLHEEDASVRPRMRRKIGYSVFTGYDFIRSITDRVF
jgi:hypothetical protein